MSELVEGKLFSEHMLKEIRKRFAYITSDPISNKERLFFDNGGGSLRLKKVIEIFSHIDMIPDHPQRGNKTAQHLANIIETGLEDIRTIFNATEGSIVTYLTASQAMFEITRLIAENIEGTNIVTTALEHPSAYDSASFYANKLSKELRVAQSNPITGGVDVEDITKLIDKDTVLLSVIYASNISGAILDIETIVKEARKIKPNIYIVVDSVQHAPHGLIDIEEIAVDAATFAPYKFFGVRGSGIAYLSERAANLPHQRLLGKDEGDLQLGSPIAAHYAAISEIVDYVCWIGSQYSNETDRRRLYEEGMTRISLHERALLNVLLDGTDNAKGLRHIPEVNVYFDDEDLSKRDLIVSISIDNIGFEEAVSRYEDKGIIVYERVASNLLSKRILDSFGVNGVIRVTPLHCNSVEEIETFLQVTQQIVDENK